MRRNSRAPVSILLDMFFIIFVISSPSFASLISMELT